MDYTVSKQDPHENCAMLSKWYDVMYVRMMHSVHAAAMATYVCKRGPSIFQSTIARHATHPVAELDARAQNLPVPRNSQRRVA